MKLKGGKDDDGAMRRRRRENQNEKLQKASQIRHIKYSFW
jgi:hypothetical protein